VSADPAWLLKTADPANAESVYRAAATAIRQGFAQEALPLAEAGARNHPTDARMWQVLGLAHRRLDALEPAVAALAKAAELAPGDALIAHSVARAAMEAGLPASALFERAHGLAPNDGSVLLGRAAAQFADGDLDGAIAGIEAQLVQHPGWLEGHNVSARLRWVRGERDAATQSLERALLKAPGEIPLWRELIDVLMHAARYDEALDAVARGRAAAGESPVFDALAAVCAAEKGDIETADRLFARLGAIEHITMAARYMRHLLRAGRPSEASVFADTWQGRDPGHLLMPYQSVAWRLTGDPRWQWLEGDERLVGVYDLADRLPPLDALAARLRTLHLSNHHPLEQSLRGGTQTDGPLFSRIEPEIRALRQAIVAAVEAHVAQLPPPVAGHPTLFAQRAPIRFSGSWSVRLTDAGFHVNHVHPMGWLSSALYVALPAMGAGDEGWLKLGEPQAELGIDLPPFRKVEPKPGRLVLFPSTMWHGTVPFAAGERMTVAFDVARPQ